MWKVLLLAWFFLGQLSFETWNQIDTDRFLNAVGQAFVAQNQCSAEIVAMTNGEIVLIYGRCSNEENPVLFPSGKTKTQI